jgi:dienelactone hydrolase
LTDLRLALFVAALLLEGVVLAALFVLYRRKVPLWTMASLLIAPQILGLVTFASGADLQLGYSWWSRVLIAAESPPFEPFTASGDPGLRRLVASQPYMTRRPDLRDARDVAAWQADLRPMLREKLFELPPAGVRSATGSFDVLSTVDLAGGIRRQFVTFQGFDGTTIPGYLFHTPGAKPRPGILVISGHGHGVVETAGLMRTYQNSVALKLAQEGYVVFTPELRGFGYLGSRIGNEHRATAHNALAAGTFYKSVVLRDLNIALDRLAALPQVDGRLAATGVSYGGELSLALTALDTRIGMAVVQGYGGERLGKDQGGEGDYFSVCNHFCHIVPQSNGFIHEEDMAVLVAPRPLLIVRGEGEGMADSGLWPILRTTYESYGAVGRFSFVNHSGYHEYWMDAALPFFRKHLPVDQGAD